MEMIRYETIRVDLPASFRATLGQRLNETPSILIIRKIGSLASHARRLSGRWKLSITRTDPVRTDPN